MMAKTLTKSPEITSTSLTQIGIGVMILKNNHVLLGRRKRSHRSSDYSFPGSHLEYMEGFEECARREALGECGIKIENVRFQFLANITCFWPKCYIQIGMIADREQGEPQILEPDKCESWGWYKLNQLPQPIFEPCLLSFESYGTTQPYFDTK